MLCFCQKNREMAYQLLYLANYYILAVFLISTTLGKQDSICDPFMFIFKQTYSVMLFMVRETEAPIIPTLT